MITLFSAAITGVTAQPVTVEVCCHNGIPVDVVVGLPDAVIKESRSRIRAAIRHAHYQYPTKVVTVNLAPAELRKEGPFFDLPIALGILQASEQVPVSPGTMAVGELALSGEVRSVRGIVSVALMAKQLGISTLILPVSNLAEAALVAGVGLVGVSHLKEAIGYLKGEWVPPAPPVVVPVHEEEGGDFCEIRGQWAGKRALEIAAAGGHNLLLVGPPGVGKTMLLKRLPGILPLMSDQEALESIQIQALHRAKPPRFTRSRPFRAPHHTISFAGLVGGGSMPVPGEISMAHHGVLFLDELPEFPRQILELLRQPLEDQTISVNRASGSVVFPADFMLVVAMNPCPCGHLGDGAVGCRCLPRDIRRYHARLSGPLLDRIDLMVPLSRPSGEEWHEVDTPQSPMGTMAIRQRVSVARAQQAERGHLNARLPSRLLALLPMSPEGKALLTALIARGVLSGRRHDKLVRVSQTIADLSGAPMITDQHLGEALGYRWKGLDS